MKEKSEFITHDIWLASALTILLNSIPDYRVSNGKTLFVFPGDDKTYKAISDFNGGVAINAYEYSQAIKKQKFEMLTRRGQK